MSAQKDAAASDDTLVSIHYIICECGETFPTENGLREHLEKEHPYKRERKEFKCGVCGSIFASEEECISHYEDTHMEAEFEEEVQEQEDLKPDLTEEGYIEEYTFEASHEEVVGEEEEVKPNVTEDSHVEYITHEGQQYVVCTGDGDQVQYYVNTEEVATEGRGRELGDRSQAACDETSRATQLLVKSQNRQHEYPVVKPPGLKMVRDPDTGALVLVFNRSAPKKPRKNHYSARPPPQSKDIVCETCGKKYASQAALKYHQRVHTGDKPYQCHLCPKAFTMPLFLQIHVRTHTGEKPYKCPDCTKAFSNRAALLRHERVHTGVKPYTCPMCMKSFTQSNSMKLHVATVHLKQPAPYKSQSRRAKEQARGQKQPYKSSQKVEKIKAFAPHADKRRVRSTWDSREDDAEMKEENETSNDDEINCYEIVYEEEVH